MSAADPLLIEPRLNYCLKVSQGDFGGTLVQALPRSKGTYTVDKDACNKQIGSVLLQKQPGGTDKPIGYYSRSIDDADRACNYTYQECHSMVWLLLLLRTYLEGCYFHVSTDHGVLKWILTLMDGTVKVAR